MNEQIANCIAEQAYTHPMNDRFAELVNAVRLCNLEASTQAGADGSTIFGYIFVVVLCAASFYLMAHPRKA